jgi:hypothetical protein
MKPLLFPHKNVSRSKEDAADFERRSLRPLFDPKLLAGHDRVLYG